VVVSRPGTTVVISLMGIFGIRFALAADLDRPDWAWVADPLDAAADAQGSLDDVIYRRHLVSGLLDEPLED